MARHEKNEKHDRREKHAAPREVIRLSDYRDREETASVSYEEPPEEEAPASPSRVPKAVYRVALILLPLVLAWYILTELGSIAENAALMGAPVPAWLVRVLKVGRQLVDETAPELPEDGKTDGE